MQDALQLGKAGMLVDQQAFDLVEHRGVGHVVVVTIDAARRYDADRRLLLLHGADLHT
ncbi:hypothetical protein D3C76_1770300 [compost metagenome]